MTTTAASTASTTTAASIVKTLGSGSGIDTAALVTGLVEAQFAARNAQLTARADALTAQISDIAKLKSGITGFDGALRSLVRGGTLSTQPTSSNTGVLGATALTGARIGQLNARVTVNALAAAQAATTNAGVDKAAAFNAGELRVTIGGATTAIALRPAGTLSAVASAISAAGLGLTATVIGDDGTARLSIKGQSGAANAFTIEGVDDDATATGLSLARLSVGANATGTTIGIQAADAEIVVDGATFHRASNTVGDMIAGVRLTLNATGTTTLGTAPPTAALSQAVSDFVETYNQLHAVTATALDPKTGTLRADPAARALVQSLGQLTTVSLAANAAGGPRTLGDLGVATNRDGTLSIDSARLAKALADHPAAVEAMFFDGTGASNGGLAAALGAITTRATDRTSGFDAELQRFTDRQADVTDAQGKAADDAAALKDRMTLQFASMDARVAAYKSTGDFLKQQVDAWYAQN